MVAADEKDVNSVAWLQAHQCGLCQGLIDICLATPCCQSTACKQCANKHVKTNSTCWTCEAALEKEKLEKNEDISDDYESIAESLVTCAVCKSVCHRAVGLPCCPGSPVCRACGVKYITSHRSCWSCKKENIRSEDVDSDQKLRDAINHLKDEGKQDKKLADFLFDRKLTALREKLKNVEEEEDSKVTENSDSDEEKNGEDNGNGAEEHNGSAEEKEEGEHAGTDEEVKKNT